MRHASSSGHSVGMRAGCGYLGFRCTRYRFTPTFGGWTHGRAVGHASAQEVRVPSGMEHVGRRGGVQECSAGFRMSCWTSVEGARRQWGAAWTGGVAEQCPSPGGR